MAQVYLINVDGIRIAQKGMHAPKRPADINAWYKDACKVLHKELGIDRLGWGRIGYKDFIATEDTVIFRIGGNADAESHNHLIHIDRKAVALGT